MASPSLAHTTLRLSSGTGIYIGVWLARLLFDQSFGTGHKLAQQVNGRYEDNDTSTGVPVPRQLVIVAVRDLFTLSDLNGTTRPHTARARAAVDNVQRTIQEIRWPYRLYTDADCVQLLHEQSRPVLLHAFKHEKYAPFASDICRAAVLYKHGGMYLDNDLVPVHTTALEGALVRHTFVSMAELADGGVCNAVVATAPRHPVLRAQLDFMAAHYQGVYGHAIEVTKVVRPLHHKNGLVGPASLRDAVLSVKDPGVYLLTETRMPLMSRFANGERAFAALLCSDCGVMIVDPGINEFEFLHAVYDLYPILYARNLGSRGCPALWWLVLVQVIWWLLACVVAWTVLWFARRARTV